MKKSISTLIKRLSTVLIPTAVGLEGWALYTTLAGRTLPGFLIPVLWLGGFALVAHSVEGVVAAVYAAKKQEDPVRWGFYTFLVGTVGLLELFELGRLGAGQESLETP
ncbi:hypothetical protein [Pseudanabaena sp. FACHB-2040]|uniref:hypothetical protein n=1 Tax=Pseudanabaena sp. FACHB-2040 TaxID=2692859 RepID=UPI0016858ED0|nr:hypothetical protein [Pseudanabaena sp. FACHB-2040]MBD2258432.1 hypothetical protein [Pseudanabaena sp. FACHB-2040]